VYGRACAPDHVLQDGDRLEIYRPLDFDPQESRRRRAAHRRAGGKGAG
jgi:putative ubiquitin-RnfH superfamily antitoxin RatB of RatAB toxin-antitoxin module